MGRTKIPTDDEKIMCKRKMSRVRGIGKRRVLVHSGSFYLMNENTNMPNIETGINQHDWYISLYKDEVNEEEEKINKGKYGSVFDTMRRKYRRKRNKRRYDG